ncbi:YgiT-type zinc finger protein [Leptospira selangorensis]|uniref:YgiT-type zinc finger protein n=1 Tax=Leptospira selangorensis TaxID=2484982 RepID=A0ABY2N186_9LEPT|nr:type II toxin-antitoxin system MqsA family antitoxin [Leptospira selangorensis]TGM14201.1 YgiT-type zinc finger protein [Leptospira selangorensis]
MKDKKWIDCPVCGETNSMVFKTDVSEIFNIKDYGNLKITNLEGYYCKNCKDGILTRKSQNHINATIAEFKAKKDAEVTVAADLISVDEMAKKLKLSRQSIHKMMNIGKIRYVFVGDIRLPLKNQKVSHK